MSSLRSWRTRFTATAICAAIFLAGCGPSDEALSKAKNEPYLAMTKGHADELQDHLDRLAQRYNETEFTDPGDARQLLLDYSTAVIGTANAILEDKTADPIVRERAADTVLTTLFRRREADPQAILTLLKTADRIEAEHAGTAIAAAAAFHRCKIFTFALSRCPIPERPEKIKQLADAVDHLARMPKAPANVPELLSKTALDAEDLKRPDIAVPLYNTLLERFPDEEVIPFIKGAMARLKLQGQVVEGVEGLGRGEKPTSLADFRGKVVLIDFWGTFCVPCTNEISALEEYRKSRESQGFVLLGICVDPDTKSVDEFLTEHKLDWPQVYSSVKGKTMASVLTHRFGVQRIPYKLVIDREGKLVATGKSLDDVKPQLDSLFADKDEKAIKPATPEQK